MAKKLKIANIGDWNYRGGHLYVCGYSQKDMVDLISEGYRKVHGLENRPDVVCFGLSYFRSYGSMNAWGNNMKEIFPERGLWWQKERLGPVEKIL